MRSSELIGFVADLDGTIIPDSAMEVDSQLIESFQKIRDVPNHIATGRSLEFCIPIFRALGIGLPAITENGSRIVNPKSNDTLYEINLEQKTTEAVLSACIDIAADARCCFAGDPEWYYATIEERESQATKGIFILDVSRQVADELILSLSEISVSAYVSNSWDSANSGLCDVNIHHPDANKGNALQKLASMYNYDLKRLLAVGNDVNDLPMFDVVGMTAAPEDAHPAVQARADIIFPSTSSLGFVKIIEMFYR